MPQRQEIVTLDHSDRAVLEQALTKAPVEQLLKQLRENLNDGLKDIHALRRASNITLGRANAARTALQNRIERLQSLPESLVDQQSVEQAVAPLQHGLELCNALEAEFHPASPPNAAHTAPTTLAR